MVLSFKIDVYCKITNNKMKVGLYLARTVLTSRSSSSLNFLRIPRRTGSGIAINCSTYQRTEIHLKDSKTLFSDNQHQYYILHTRSQGGVEGFEGTPPWKLITTIKDDILWLIKVLIGVKFEFWKTGLSESLNEVPWNYQIEGFCSKYPWASGGCSRPPDLLPRGVDEPPSGNSCLWACFTTI